MESCILFLEMIILRQCHVGIRPVGFQINSELRKPNVEIIRKRS